MIRSHHLHTLSFPWLVLSPRGRILDSGDGTLFKAPLEARSDASLTHLISAPVGWSTCPAGYAVYCREIPDLTGFRLAFYGLKIAGISTRAGKSSFLSIRLRPEEMERYVNEMMITFNHIDDNVTFLVNRGIHNFRHINSDIKNAAEDLKFLLESAAIDFYSVDRQIGRVKALSEIVSARLNFLDYFSNPVLATKNPIRITAFKKFDKAKRVLAHRAFERDIRINLFGSGKRLHHVPTSI